MRQKRHVQRPIRHQKSFLHALMIAMFLVGLVTTGAFCEGSRTPQVGVFPIKVVALTSDKVGIPKAKVSINNKVLGETDQFGTFVGTYRGKVNERIRIKVEGAGQDNYMIMSSLLRLRRIANGLAPAEIKVEAFLRQPPPEDTNGGGTNPPSNPPLAGNPPTNTNPPSNPPTNTNPPSDPPTNTNPPVIRPRSRGNGGAAPPRNNGGSAPKFSGRYRIKVISNVSGIRVYMGKRLKGTIRVPEGIVSVKHRDRSESPQAVSITLKAKKPWLYKTPEVTREVSLNTSQEEYEIRVDFEKAPPFKIIARANTGGVRVSMGKQKQEITDANTPVTFEYTGRPRTMTLVFRPSDRKVKPRRLTKKVKLVAGTFEYTAETAEFKLPEPPAVVARREPVEPRGGGTEPQNTNPAGTGDPGPSNPPLPPANTGPTFSGKFAITVSSSAKGTVYKNGRRVGRIRTDGGSFVVKHKDKSASPKPLMIKVRAARGDAFKVRDVEKEVALQAGTETYTVEMQFEKRPGIVVKAFANQKGTRVMLGRKLQGEVVDVNNPVNIDYDGKPRGSLSITFMAPGSNFKPNKIRKSVRLKRGVFEYEVRAEFNEFDPGSAVTLKPNCFRRSRGKKRVVLLKASAGTSFAIKSSEGQDCGEEALPKTGKTGMLKVQMPAGFVRIIAIFGDGSKTEKTFEVSSGSGTMSVNFSRGGKRCNLKRIQAKIRNSIFLEEEEVACLRNVKKSNSQFFSAHTSLSRFYCHKRAYNNGKSVLDELYKDPRNRFQPYRAMSLGIEYSRCKSYDRALSLLRQAERTANRFAANDKYVNQKSLYKALTEVYERRYYAKKNITDLRRALKSVERLADIVRGDDSDKGFAKKNIARLKSLLSRRGGLEE
ncbi:MAG: hypothetical protein H6727_05240 [Myxococcales bacterium]|nr:hypothetical protein [Myxococcales bacterium]